MNNPFESLTGRWRAKLELARKDKKECFQRDADEAMRFYSKPHDFVFESGYGLRGGRFSMGRGAEPTFKITVNKVFELVSIFLPFFYHRNPTRLITPRKPVLDANIVLALIPPEQLQQMAMQGVPPEAIAQMQQNPMLAEQMMQQLMDPARLAQLLPQTRVQQQDMIRAKLMEHYLNYTPNEYDLKGESRQAIIEAIIKGRGLLWPELIERPDGRRVVASKYDTVDRLLIDPDAETVKDAAWIAREGDATYYDLEERHGLPRDYLKQYAKDASNNERSKVGDDPNRRATGKTSDMIHYYRIWSRIGCGGLLSGSAQDDAVQAIEAVGKYAYLVIADGVPFPLNVSPEFIEQAQEDEQLTAALSWPTPFHDDPAHPWPFAHLDFHLVPRQPWPQAHITPAMGYQIFLDWCYSFLAAKMRFTSRDFIVGPASLDDDVKNALLNGPDLTYLPLSQTHQDSYKGVVDFLQHRPMNKDIWDVLSAVQHEFEKSTGMTELVYGMSQRQMRSAEEASVKRDMTNIRPDDMAQMVENWMTVAARMEGICARYHLAGNDVSPIFGEGSMELGDTAPPYTCTGLWEELVKSDSMVDIVSELEYRIEAGSTRKPNPDKDKQDIDESAQVFLPTLMQVYHRTGNSGPINAFLKRWAKARQFDADEFLIPDMQQQMQMQAMQAQAAQAQGGPQEGQPQQQGPPQ